jgi:hypothetical protein
MGVDTHGYVDREVTASDIYNVILNKFDKDAIFDINVRNNYEGEPEEIGNILFKIGEDQRKLFICYGEVNQEDQNSYMEFNGNRKYTYLSLGFWGNSEKIMTDIVKSFGGYVDENDCDDISAIYISQLDNLEYEDFVKERNSIVNVLDEKLVKPLKIQIANQILKHKEQLKKLL